MTLAHYITWILLVGTGFALFAGSAGAQPPLPKKDSAAFNKASELRDAPKGIQPAELKEAKDTFARVAKYYGEVVAHPSVYKTPQEFKLDPPGTVHLTIDGTNGILYDLTGRLFLDRETLAPKFSSDQIVYVREMGAALDTELKELIEKSADPIVRVNAARVLAHVCRAGGPAHYPTLTALIGNANTRTEIKYHLLHAAANLLAARDPNWLKTRNHVSQTEDPKTVGALVKAVDECVTNPAQLVAGLPKKMDEATDDQLAVVGLVRRQAIKALAQVRYVVVAGPDGQPLYPVHTLCRVALSDPALLPAPAPADAAEAVIGICNMAPVEAKGDKVTPVKYNADAALEAVNAGLITFASPRAADAFDRRLPWRSYSLRLAEALRNWRPLFDPDYDISKPNTFDVTRVPKAVEDFFKDTVPKVLAPMDRVDASGKPDVGSKVDIEGLRSRLTAVRATPNRPLTLVAGVPATSIDFGPPKK